MFLGFKLSFTVVQSSVRHGDVWQDQGVAHSKNHRSVAFFFNHVMTMFLKSSKVSLKRGCSQQEVQHGHITYSDPWKIPSEVDSSIVAGLPRTVEVEGVSNQHFDMIWGDLHFFKDKGCKNRHGK